jgi:hypothetical protein
LTQGECHAAAVPRATSVGDGAVAEPIEEPGNRQQDRVNGSSASRWGFLLAAGRPAAVTCHGPWTLVEADVIRDRRLTSWPSLQTDIRNAGGNWVDEQVVECSSGTNRMITSRKPG